MIRDYGATYPGGPGSFASECRLTQMHRLSYDDTQGVGDPATGTPLTPPAIPSRPGALFFGNCKVTERRLHSQAALDSY